MPEVDRAMGNEDKLLPSLGGRIARVTPGSAGALKIAVSDIMAASTNAAPLVEAREGRSRAFVQVQNGCDHRCTFCIIPRAWQITPTRSQPSSRRCAGWSSWACTKSCSPASTSPVTPQPTLLVGMLVKRILREVPELSRRGLLDDQRSRP
jgi:threonylcarbamoyladenosine tRNA methylthiotransferase MtaB